MPLSKEARPSSAAGKLETQNVPSIVTELWGIGEKKAKTSVQEIQGESGAPGADLAGYSEGRKRQPLWLVRELLKQGNRRHSVTLGDDAHNNGRLPYRAGPYHSLCKLKIEQRVSLGDLLKLKLAFEEFEIDGLRSLDTINFGLIVKKCLGLHNINDAQIQELFMKIDYSGQGRIVWDEFCTYMQLEYTEKEDSVTRTKQVAFTLPATIKALCHGEPILKVHCTPDGTVITLREDGAVYYWTSELQLKKSKTVFHERPLNRKPKWATDLITMMQYNKVIIGTGDREIQLYELSSLEPYCQISALETVPLRLDYCYTGPDECCILYGDAQGCVNIILIKSVGETLRMWKKLPKIENVPNIGIDIAVLNPNVTYICWKVHEDWVTKVKYFQNIRAVVSTSNHEGSALVIGCVLPSTNIERQMREIREVCREGKAKKVLGNCTPQPRAAGDQTVFTIYKGVKTFDLSKKHNLLVTGGMDRLLRMWNPYVPGKPTGILKGHSAPIFYLCIVSEENRILSVSMDNVAKIWDIQDQCCLFTAHPKASQIRGDMSACIYSPSVKCLYVSSDSLALLSLKTRPQPQSHVVMSHKEPVLCCGYSQQFRQVVSCTEGSVVKVWEIDTGDQVFEFGEAHGQSAITCMTFDHRGRRLVTGGRDGCLKIWNFNNGQCLKILKKDGESREVCDCSYLTVYRNTYVMSVGWDRKIDIYSETPEDSHQVQRPLPPWQDDLKNGHKEDIMCIAQCPPSLLATSSYDGEIIVWNLLSGHIQCRYKNPPPPPHEDLQGVDTSVPSILFLQTRALHVGFSSAACLVSSGSKGCINFWNVLNGGKFVASFEASRFQHQITKLAVTKDDTSLYAADQAGFVYVYDIKTYALGTGHTLQTLQAAKTYWRAHTSSITGLQIVDSDQVVLTSSVDCTVRLWSSNGQFIGTFGQAENWSLHTPSSWKHPSVPYEVLMDPLSMPVHHLLDGEKSMVDVTNTAVDDITAAGPKQSDSNSKFRYPSVTISDTDIEEEIKTRSYPEEQGKRLRHEIFKHTNKPPNHGGPKAYHTLKYFDIKAAPATCERPDLSLAGIDPFISSPVDLEPPQTVHVVEVNEAL
ncbi:cilia- and flagella-associated protein 337 [Osmerus mordax]|uniref:cilia- and flagella-associated protein 337 n=1 Tax=Osmerus mordax TaxID=8014 RepID=UPI00350F1E04